MKIFVKGASSVSLSKNDFKASGGFGDVYVKNNIAYKIYQDPKNSLPEAKISELSKIKNPNVIKPLALLINNNNLPIGYSMQAVPDGHVLCEIFPKPFKKRNSLTADTIINLVRRMQETISAIHAENILIVDLNEMNFIVDKSFNEVYFIDVDSYQTPSFPATAIMESVRDRHSKQFNNLTDWFSFAIISYQMFRGLHPFRAGQHDVYKTLDERMLHNVSILNPSVSYPKGTAWPEDVIPQSYRDWYRAVFEDGKRLPPPTSLQNTFSVVTQVVKKLTGTLFEIVPLDLFSREGVGGEVLGLYRSGNKIICVSTQKIYLENGKSVPYNAGAVVGFTPKQNKPIAAWLKNHKLCFSDLDGHTVFVNTNENLFCEQIMSYENRIYVKSSDSILEMKFIETPEMVKILYREVAKVLPLSSKLFQGCVIQNMLGSIYANIFVKSDASAQIRLKELEGAQLISAKLDGRVLMAMTNHQGKYSRHIFFFNTAFSAYAHKEMKDVPYTDINFVGLPQGIYVAFNEDNSVEIFNETQNKNVSDSNVHDIELLKDGSKIVFHENGKFHQLTLK